MLPERLRPTIISAIGRIHLLLGDVGAAKECFAAVTSSQPEHEQLQNQLNRFVPLVMFYNCGPQTLLGKSVWLLGHIYEEEYCF